MAQGEPGARPGEFGGVPGMYGNMTGPDDLRLRMITPVLEPHQARMALSQTRPDKADSQPLYGGGGKRVR